MRASRNQLICAVVALASVLLAVQPGSEPAFGRPKRPRKWGAEFNFTSQSILDEKAGRLEVNSKEAVKKMGELAARAKELCPKCVVTTVDKDLARTKGLRFKVTLENGFWFMVETDPGVVEVTTKPATLAELKANRKQLQQLIFGAAEDVHLYSMSTLPFARDTAFGHSHFGTAEAFEGDAVRFRNYLVDQANHGEVNGRMFANDIKHAATFSSLSAAQQDALERVIRRFDAGEIRGLIPLAEAVEREVYTEHPAGPQYRPKKDMAVVLERLTDRTRAADERTIQQRGQRAQLSVDEFIDQSELTEARLDFLERNFGGDKRVPFAPDWRVPPSQMTDEQAARKFYRWLTEMGRDPEQARQLLIPQSPQRNALKRVIAEEASLLGCVGRGVSGR